MIIRSRRRGPGEYPVRKPCARTLTPDPSLAFPQRRLIMFGAFLVFFVIITYRWVLGWLHTGTWGVSSARGGASGC